MASRDNYASKAEPTKTARLNLNDQGPKADLTVRVDSETLSPKPRVVKRRRCGGRKLPTGVVKKVRQESETAEPYQGGGDMKSYSQQVMEYQKHSGEEDPSIRRSLVK